MNKKIALGQFYTPTLISYSMVKLALEFLRFPPKNVIELAAGLGDLLIPLKQLVPSSDITAVDIDSDNAIYLQNHLDIFHVHNADSTGPLNFLEGKFYDLALANPPFVSNIKVNNYIQKILKEYLNLDYVLDSTVRAELIFICQYLSILNTNGILAIILPESLISGVKFIDFRKALTEKWQIEHIVEIEGSPFSFTEAKTHIIYIRKCEPTTSVIKMSCMNEIGECSQSVKVSKAQLVDRMDFSFLQDKPVSSSHLKKLGDYASIKRGKKTHKALLEEGKPYLHSIHANSYKQNSNLLESELYLCRVGTRVVGKSFLYYGDKLEVSDCLYHLQFDDPIVKLQFYDFINTEIGYKKLKCTARGVCSKYLTLRDLKNFTF